MNDRISDSSVSTSLRDAVVGIAIALGGGWLLLAAILHLAAPVVIFAPAPSTAMAGSARAPLTAGRRGASGRAIVRAVPRASTHAIRQASASLPTARVARYPTARAKSTARSTHAPLARTIPKRIVAQPGARGPIVSARNDVVRRAVPARTAVERFVRLASPARTAAKPTLGVRASVVVLRGRANAPRLAARRGARTRPANATPKPPVGFNMRPKLVVAPLDSDAAALATGSTGATGGDSRFAGIRVRGRTLPTPVPIATPLPTPIP